MSIRARPILSPVLSAAAILTLLPATARADVTIGQRMSMSFAGLDIDINSIERTSADKQRYDTSAQCHGFLSFFCHDIEGGRIIRLDRRLEWRLDPKKKLYSVHPFPTPGQRAAAQKEFQAALKAMKNCPMPQSAGASPQAPDTSHCQLSSPVLKVTATGEHATIIGHDARKTDVVLSQTCTDRQTGDVCEINYGFEVWLTSDAIAGTDERSAFTRKYLAAEGLDPNSPQLQHTVERFMAPYAGELKQLQGKAADLKGYPLRTTFYMAFGGPHCARAKQAAQQQQASSGHPFSMHSIVSHALAGGFAGLFHRGAAAIPTGSAGGAAAAGAANEAAQPAAAAAANSVTAQSSPASPAAAPAPGALLRVISLTTETTSIDTSSIPPDEFQIPADWKIEPRKQARSALPKCPTSGK